MAKKKVPKRATKKHDEESDDDESYSDEGRAVANQQQDSSSVSADGSEDSSSSEGDDGDLQALGYGEEGAGSDDDDSDDDDSEGEETSSGEEEYAEEEEDSDEDDVDVTEERQIYTGDEGCTLDLRNLTAVNSHQVNTQTLYKNASKKKSKKNKKADLDDTSLFATIPPTDSSPKVNEEQLLATARAGCAQILKGLWSLETERTDVGPMAILPNQFEIKTPRELPPPPPKKETKWEKFAKERGIPTNKEKRSRKVWDDATGTWMYRHGYQKANDATNIEWPIMEVGGNDDPYEDPWERARDAKRSRVEKNTENRMRNMERGGLLAKGTTTRTLKDMAKAREVGRSGGRGGELSGGIPLDMSSKKQRGMDLTKKALIATQRSTASLGKFDMMREGEPERKKAMAGLKKRKFESSTDRKVVKTEADRNAKMLDIVMKGGGVEKEKAVRRGEYAKGETAYDYEHNDGSSGFKKKKGRAGAGKMKKLTKKRAK